MGILIVSEAGSLFSFFNLLAKKWERLKIWRERERGEEEKKFENV